MLLIHNDEPQISDWCKDGRPGTDDDPDFTALNAAPLIVPGRF
jgi:hypothetical protein